jgi:hypothetical protein
MTRTPLLCRTGAVWLTSVLAAALMAGGCGRPRPPVLQQNLEVFHDEKEGYSFRPPQGWIQAARGNVVSKEDRGEEIELVKYKRGSGKQMVFFRVSAVDLPEGTDLAAYLDKALGKADKRVSTKPEDVKIGGLPAKRETYNTTWDRDAMVKEIVAVRRGPRVYFFTATFAPSDKPAREAVQKILDSVTWEADQKA